MNVLTVCPPISVGSLSMDSMTMGQKYLKETSGQDGSISKHGTILLPQPDQNYN